MFWAKAYLTYTGTGGALVTCDLKAGGDLDEAKTGVGAMANTANIAMNVAHVFTAPGTADLVCSASGGAGGSANFATVSGIQVANLTRADG
jgi:hypothetical protein